MDILSAIGFVLAVCAVLVGAVLKGAGVHALLSAAAFMIVVVGTFAAIFIQTPLSVFKHAMSRFSWVIKPPPVQAEELIKKIVEWSTIARKQGLLGLEPLIEQEQDPFVKRGLQLVVDGGEPDAIRAILEVEVGVREHADTRAAKALKDEIAKAQGNPVLVALDAQLEGSPETLRVYLAAAVLDERGCPG